MASRSRYLMRQFGLLSEQMSNPPFERENPLHALASVVGYNLMLHEEKDKEKGKNTLVEECEESTKEKNERKEDTIE